MKKISLFLVYFLSFLYMEFIFKIFTLEHIFRLSIINMIFFLITFSFFCALISRVFNKIKYNKIVYLVIMGLIAFWFSAEFVVKGYFDFYISLSTFKVADQLTSFVGKGIIETLKRLPIIILFFAPIIVTILFHKHIEFDKRKNKKHLFVLGLTFISYALYLLSLNIGASKEYSAHELYYKINNVSLNMENFGVINTFTIDLKRAIFGFEEKITIDNNLNDSQNKDNKHPDDEPVYTYNNLDIDFDNLINNTNNSTLKKMHEYFKNDTGTLKNAYTGMFKGKNLILFMAESFNEIAVNEKLTPTLYKLVHNGFSFENFYTPTIYSTIGGEFQELTGLYAESTGTLAKFRSGNIKFPQGIGNVYKNIGYHTFAYHNNSYVFQDRNKYLKSIGFDNFKACYNGLEKLINCNEWPQSDVAMIDATINDYINTENFMVFYASVSGHASYNFKANASARRNKEEYNNAGFSYSEGPASYLAAQMELDKALEKLIQKLDEKGILDDTVIALVGDHYPYELSIDEINEISSYKKESEITVNKSNFILWNNKMEPVKIQKVGSQLDVIPTIYNLFGISYDSRLFIGKDILSTEGGLAIFGNRSWVSDKGSYYASKRKFIPNKEVVVEDDYVKKINQIVNNKITMSKQIIENNYYAIVLK